MILVTGGTGHLGSHLLQTLVASGKVIRCTYRKRILQYVPLEAAKHIDWHEADLLDVTSLDQALEGVDQVYHCAGMVSFQKGDKQRMMEVNVRGTGNLINACLAHGIKKLVHVSSVAALGRPAPEAHIDENSSWEDSRHNSAYGLSKYHGELEVWRGIGEGLNAVIVNPSIFIGPSRGWDDASARLVRNSYEGFPWYTRGVNAFVNVKDVARVMVRLMDSPFHSERFIVSAENWSYQQFFSAVHKYLGTGVSLKYAAPWMGELIWRLSALSGWVTKKKPRITKEMARTASLKVYYDNRKIKEALPDFNFTPLEQTIEETCRAFLKHMQSLSSAEKTSKEPRTDI
jgi:nucleoside-diphosphate-sugar epimerase